MYRGITSITCNASVPSGYSCIALCEKQYVCVGDTLVPFLCNHSKCTTLNCNMLSAGSIPNDHSIFMTGRWGIPVGDAYTHPSCLIDCEIVHRGRPRAVLMLI